MNENNKATKNKSWNYQQLSNVVGYDISELVFITRTQLSCCHSFISSKHSYDADLWSAYHKLIKDFDKMISILVEKGNF